MNLGTGVVLVRRVCMTVLLIIGFLTGMPAAGETGSAHADSGTLNLLLANRNGFVIAADSRRSRPSPFAYWDDSQKLFRVGPKSAAVISGFASWVNGGSPIDFQVAAALREEFSDTEWEKGKRKLPNLPPTLMSLVGEQLTMFAGLLAANGESPTALNFQMLAAGFDKSKLVLLRLEFRPHIEVYGPFGLPVPRYEPVVTTKVVRHFECLSAGVDDLARSVLDGGFSTIDPRILEYYRARNEGKLDQLSLNSLEDLAVAILEETKRVTPVVGGPDQIGVFPKHGSVRWHLPELPGSRQKLRSTVLNVGASYSWEGFPANEHSQMRGKQAFSEISMSLSQPFEEQFTQVFLGGMIRDVPVMLDGNVFAGNRFINVHFRYAGRPFHFDSSNHLEACWLQISEGVEFPNSTELRQCTVGRVRAVVQEHTVGSSIRARPVGCVSRSSNGRIVIKKKGRQHGFDCKNSRIEVPQAIGPFQLQRPPSIDGIGDFTNNPVNECNGDFSTN